MSRKRTQDPTVPQISPSKMALVMGHADEGKPTPVVPDKTRYERFVDYVTTLLAAKDCFQLTDEDPARSSGYYGRESKAKEEWLSVRWETGGVTGGSCYGGDTHSYTTSNVPEELASLDYILEALHPNITYIQYKILAATVVKSDTYSQNEYYGNHTDYAIKKVRLRDLYEYMLEKGWGLP